MAQRSHMADLWLMSLYLCALTYSTAYEISLGGLISSLGAERNSPIAIKKLHKYLLSDHKGFEFKHSKCILARIRILAASLIGWDWESIWEAKWRESIDIKSGYKNVYSLNLRGNITKRKHTVEKSQPNAKVKNPNDIDGWTDVNKEI